MYKNFFQFKLIFIILIAVFLITTGLGCKTGVSEKDLDPVNLVYWRTDDDRGDFSTIINGFQKLHPNISITFKKVKKENYTQEILEAWAENKGPDIFSIPNTWLGKYREKVSKIPLGAEFSLPKKVTTGTIKKTDKIIEEAIKVPSLRDLQKRYVSDVFRFIIKDQKQIYGLPLNLDTLVMYYNRDMLDSNNIPNPPKNWQEFVKDVKLLTLQDRNGNFIQSGAALGTAENIEYSTDILSLLMMQNGAFMAQNARKATFDLPLESNSNYFPGIEALNFYTSFSNPAQPRYSWNRDLPNAFDAFISGRLGFLFGYSDYLQEIKKQAPKLNFSIASVPQISDSLKNINYAKYPIEVVSKNSSYQNEAWAFLLYASKQDNVESFLEKSKHPTAHRNLIKKQLEDFDLAPFANQVLTASSWYKGSNYNLVKEAFNGMINSVITGAKSSKEAIEYGVNKINLTY